MEELKFIIKEIQSYKTNLNLKNLSDDMILDCSVRIFNSNNIESKKENKSDKKPNIIPATEKQKKLLRKLKYDGDLDSLSVKEASMLIDKLMK